jgi:outer membrane protein assembly factor BamC
VTCLRLSALGLAALLAGCSSIDGLFSGDKADTAVPQARPLDVPPDLSQLARDNRYTLQGGVVSAAAAASGATAGPGVQTAVGAPTIALQQLGGVHLERDGNQRWLDVPMSPEQLWPLLQSFWQSQGFTIAKEDATAGVMETEWHEDRTKLPNDIIRNTIGRVLGSLYDTGLRDRFRTRIERTAKGSEVYITHYGLEQVYTDQQKTDTTWRARPADPQLEAVYLSRLMERLGTKAEAAKAAVAAGAASAPAAGVVEQASHARLVAGAKAAEFEIDEGFDRAWRLVGLALDRSGFTVEDRDRSAGLYYVRYVDPKLAGQEEPGFFARLFSSKKEPTGPLRYRLAVKAAGAKTNVTVQTADGAPTGDDNARRIAQQLVNDLR